MLIEKVGLKAGGEGASMQPPNIIEVSLSWVVSKRILDTGQHDHSDNMLHHVVVGSRNLLQSLSFLDNPVNHGQHFTQINTRRIVITLLANQDQRAN